MAVCHIQRVKFDIFKRKEHIAHVSYRNDYINYAA